MRLAILCILLLAVPSTAYYVASPVGEVGQIPVDTPVTFHVAADNEGVPLVHTDVDARVLWNDMVIFESTEHGGHEYDGVQTFTVTFPGVGTYAVQSLENGVVMDEVTGTVYAPDFVDVAIETTTNEGPPWTHQFDITTHSGAHTEAIIWAKGDERTLWRTSLHEHDVASTVAWERPLEANVEILHSYLQTGDTSFRPVVETVSSSFAQVPPALGQGATPATHTARNTVTTVDGDGMKLVATYDPYTVVGPDTPMRIAIIALDPETNRPMPHTQFMPRLVGPSGPIWSADGVHEHDGVWEFMSTQSEFGGYRLEVSAENGDASAHIDATYNVVPPIEATNAGPITLDVEALAPSPHKLFWINATLSNVQGPYGHGEIDFAIAQGGIPILMAKAHSHNDGFHAIKASLPAGDYTLHAEPFALESRPVTFTGDLVTEFTVASAPGEETYTYTETRTTEGKFDLQLALIAAAVIAVAAIIAMLVVKD